MKKKSVKVNYIYNLIYNLLALLLPLITTPYLSRVLGAKQIGIYGYTLSIVTYFILFGSLGVAMYGQREIAYVQDNINARSKKFWEIILLRLITMTISMILFYFLNCVSGNNKIYYIILLLYMISNMLDVSWYFQGMEFFDKTVIRNLIVKTLSLILIFVLVKNKNDLWKYILIFSISELFGNLTMWMYLRNNIKIVKLKELNIKANLKPVLSLFIPQIAIQVYTVLDKTMIGLITNDMSQVGLYEQAQKVVQAALIIISAYSTVVASKIAFSFSKKNRQEVIKYLSSSFNFVWAIALPMMFGLIAISNKFVPWFFGPGYKPVIAIINVTAPILLVIGLNGILGNQYLIQVGKQKYFSIAVVIGACSNIALNTIFINLCGAIGAALASVISEIVVLLVEMYFVRKDIPLKIIFLSVKNYLISSIFMLVFALLLTYKLPINIFSTFLEIIFSIVVYSILLIIFKDKYFIDLLKSIKSFLLLKVGKDR
jgi:O-antigen/teichoic acid export membrane protein